MRNVEPQNVEPGRIRTIGVSRPKAAYARGLADAIVSGDLGVTPLDTALGQR